jgi:hypothetical protein
VAVSGFAIFFGTEMVVNGHPPGGAIPLFVIPGILFLISHGLAVFRQGNLLPSDPRK